MTKNGSHTNLKAQLQRLIERHELDLGTYAWLYETDRWAELIFCLLNQCTQQEPEFTRQTVDMLQDLNLLQIDKLIVIENSAHENAVVLTYILKLHGFSEEDSQRAISLLAQVAKAIQKDYGGKIQRCLRKHGLSIRDELVNTFHGESLDDEHLRIAISHWLQNAFSLPVSLKNPASIEYCEKNQVSFNDLWNVIDDLDLNLAFVDDLFELELSASKDVGDE